MLSIKQLRTELNMTQADMAHFLVVPMSVFSMAEGGQRMLPPGTGKKLSALENLSMEIKKQLESDPAFRVPQLLVLEEEFSEKLAHKIIQQNRRITLLEEELTEMKEMYSRVILKAKVMQQLMDTLPEDGEALYERSWSNVQWSKAITEMKKCHPSMQKMLRIKIELAKAEIEIIKRIIDES